MSRFQPPYRPQRPTPPMNPRFQPRPQKPTAKPRRVVNGVKLRSKEGPDVSAWAAQRWMRLVEQNAPPANVAEGIEYGRLGQTRTMDIQPGAIAARVQGRMPDAYNVAVRLPTFTAEQWEQVLAAMTAQARYAAALLSGDLPAGIEDVFAPLGLRLFPVDPSDLAVSCTCDVPQLQVMPGAAPSVAPATPPATPLATPPAAPTSTPTQTPTAAPAGPAAPATGWCKHICCVMAVIADRIAVDPFLIFTLRGLRGEELLERLRQQRVVSGAARAVGAGGDVPIYMPHLPGISDRPSPPLEESIDTFWSLGPGLEELELPIGPPEVTHPLLRRLGPSPFDPATARFPLVGLLATCYDVISAAAIREEEGESGEVEGGVE